MVKTSRRRTVEIGESDSGESVKKTANVPSFDASLEGILVYL